MFVVMFERNFLCFSSCLFPLVHSLDTMTCLVNLDFCCAWEARSSQRSVGRWELLPSTREKRPLARDASGLRGTISRATGLIFESGKHLLCYRVNVSCSGNRGIHQALGAL